MVLIAVLCAFVLGAIAVFMTFFGVTRVPAIMAQRRLDQRLSEVAVVAEEEGNSGGGNLLKDRKAGMFAAVERMAGGSDRASGLSRWVDQSGVKISLGKLLIVALCVAGFAGFAAMVVIRTAWALPLGAVVGFAMPFMYLKMKRRRRLNAFEEQFPEALDLISRALKAGHAFATGLKMVADEMPEPVGPEFRKAFDEQNFGLPLKDSLDNLSQRIPLLDIRFFATAVLIQRETGGNLSEILENLAHVVRERFKILRQVRVYTAHGRLTGYVLLGLPAFLSVALMFINPDHMNLLFRERMGQQMLMAALVMMVIGYVWIQQVIKIEV